MLERLFKFQRENEIELEYYFKGYNIVVVDSNLISFNSPISFSNIDQLEEFVLNSINNLKRQNLNVIPLHNNFKESIVEDQDYGAKILEFPKKKNKFVLEKSDPNDLARACLCVNNIREPITSQSEEYKNLHKDGILSFHSYKELKDIE